MKMRTRCTQLIGVVAACGIGYMLANAATPAPSLAKKVEAVEIDRIELMTVMGRAGLSPEALAVSGVTADDLPAILARAEDHLREAEWALSAADELCRSRDTEAQRLQEVCSTGQDQEGDHEALDAATLLAAEAATARIAVLDGIFEAAVAGLSDQSISTLRIVRSNQGDSGEPELLVVRRTPEEWQSLREALASTRSAQIRQAPDEVRQHLARVRAESEVVAARERLASLQQLRQAWAESFQAR